MLYVAIILLLCFLVYFYDYRQVATGRWFWFIIVTVIFIFLGALRYRVGLDSLDYERFYNNLSPLNFLTQREVDSSRFAPGFVILASFTKLFTDEPVLLYTIQSAFVCIVASWFFKNNTRHIFFALLMFFIFQYTLLVFEQIREAIAVGFFLLAWPAFKSNKWIKWYALSLCAMLFHLSASVMLVLPVILVPGIRYLFIFGKRTWVICTLILIFGFILKARFGQYIQLIAVTQGLENLTTKYEDTNDVNRTINIVGMIGQLIRAVIYPLWALIYFNVIKKSAKKIKQYDRLEMMVMISVYISIVSIGVPIISRINNYFFFFPVILISDWVFNYVILNRRKIKLGFVSWAIFLLPMFALQIYSYWGHINKSGTYKNYMAYYPYTSYLDKEKNAERVRVIHTAKRH